MEGCKRIYDKTLDSPIHRFDCGREAALPFVYLLSRAWSRSRVHRTRRITQGRHWNTRQQGSRMTSWSVPRPHYELLCCAGDYGSAASNIEDIGSPGVSPLPAYYSAAEQSPITSSGTVQKGRPRKRKLSEVTGSELPVTMRLAAGALGELHFTLLFNYLLFSDYCFSVMYFPFVEFLKIVWLILNWRCVDQIDDRIFLQCKTRR